MSKLTEIIAEPTSISVVHAATDSMLEYIRKHVHGFSMEYSFSMITTEFHVRLRKHVHVLAQNIVFQ
jgi:hypothetical protein